MASPSTKNVLRIPSRLAWNPTNLSTAYPHGGTALGLARAIAWKPGIHARPITAEEWGGITVEAVYAGSTVLLSAVLREWDRDAISTIFLDSAAGGTTARRVARGRETTESYRAGTSLASKAGVLLVSPESSQHPAIILYRAIPIPDVAAEIRMALSEEFGFPVLFHGTPNGSGDTHRIGLLSDLSL